MNKQSNKNWSELSNLTKGDLTSYLQTRYGQSPSLALCPKEFCAPVPTVALCPKEFCAPVPRQNFIKDDN